MARRRYKGGRRYPKREPTPLKKLTDAGLKRHITTRKKQLAELMEKEQEKPALRAKLEKFLQAKQLIDDEYERELSEAGEKSHVKRQAILSDEANLVPTMRQRFGLKRSPHARRKLTPDAQDRFNQLNREWSELRHNLRARQDEELFAALASHGLDGHSIHPRQAHRLNYFGAATSQVNAARESLGLYEAELQRRSKLQAAEQAQVRQREDALKKVSAEAVAQARVLRAALQGRSREEARRIRHQFKKSDICPYCGCPLGEDCHLEHIYPVAKGGLSSTENMVFVCPTCNLQKGAQTLNQFIRSANLNRDEIERRLSALGKDF